MSNDFIHLSQRSSAKEKYTFKGRPKPAMMSGALPSPPADKAENASSTRKNATTDFSENGNGTPPSAQRPPPSQDSSPGQSPIMAAVAATDDEADMDYVDDGALLAPTKPTKTPKATKAKAPLRNAFTVLASSQAAMRTTPAARPPTTKWDAAEEWTVVEGIRDGLSQAQIRKLLPRERSGSAIRGKKKELQEKYGERLENMSAEKPLNLRTPAPPVPLRKTWTSAECGMLRTCMRQGMSDRDIQAKHFPDRTEDSVIGKLRKLRGPTVKSQTNSSKAMRFSSLSQYASSSPAPAAIRSSDQTVQRSSPAQAALKRKSEVITDHLPVVQEEVVDTEPSNDAEDVEDDSVAESIVPNSSAPSEVVRKAYVVIPEHTDLRDVVDLREQALVHHSGEFHDQEARYAATTPPFLPGEENDKEGVLRTTKLGLWREAYSRCHGNVERAYRKYERLRTDEHMLQAVCNLDYEIINGVKAVRMRRAREDALREGKPLPITPVSDQPQHLDLYGEKHYGKYYKYKPWQKEIEAMYLNEPITFGPRPGSGKAIECVNPVHEAIQDDGDDEGEDEYAGDGYDEVGGDEGVAHEDSAPGAVDEEANTAPKPFHGHVSEIEDEAVESDVIMSGDEADHDESVEHEEHDPAAVDGDAHTLTAGPDPGHVSEPDEDEYDEPNAIVFFDEAGSDQSPGQDPVIIDEKVVTAATSPDPAHTIVGENDKSITSHNEFGPDESVDHTKHIPGAVEGAISTVDASTMPVSGHVSDVVNDEDTKSRNVVPPHHFAEPASVIKQGKTEKRTKKRKHSTSEESNAPPVSKKQKKSEKGHKHRASTSEEGAAPPVSEEQKKPEKRKDSVPDESSASILSKKEHKQQKQQKKRLKQQQLEQQQQKEKKWKRKQRKPAAQEEKKRQKKKKEVDKDGVVVSLNTLRRQKQHLRRSDASIASEATDIPTKAAPKQEVAVHKVESMRPPPVIVNAAAVAQVHPEDNPSQWMRDIVKNAKHKPPPVRHKSPPPVDPNNLFGRGDPSDSSDSSASSGD